MLNKETLYHLAATSFELEPKIYPQSYMLGFNIEGRPAGLWCSYGDIWPQKLKAEASDKYKPCCIMYEVNLRDKPIDIQDPRKFTKECADTYFLNIDYYHIKFVDRLSGEKVNIPPKRTLFAKYPEVIRDAKKMGLFEALISHEIVFTDPEDARRKSSGYSAMVDTIERHRYIKWDSISGPGVMFHYDANDAAHNYYFWAQSLDIPSCCMWDTTAVAIGLATPFDLTNDSAKY